MIDNVLFQQVVDSYNKGLSIYGCSTIHGICKSTVWNWIKRVNINRTLKECWNERRRKEQKYGHRLNWRGEKGREMTRTLEKQRRSDINNKNQWETFFIQYYGKEPLCEICGRKLKFMNGKKRTECVCFDHKKDELKIKNTPGMWIRKHYPNKKNIETFLDCDFGILCGRCNISLPTKNRKEWFKNVSNYVNK